MFELAEKPSKKNLKVGVGLMCRHCQPAAGIVRPHPGRRDRRHLAAAGLSHGRPDGDCFSGPSRQDISELLCQIQRFHGFLWASGGIYSDFLIHNIDECCWMKDAWPVKAQALGGRHYRGN